MSTDTQKLIEICEQLAPAEQTEVMDFARQLLERHRVERVRSMDEWLKTAVGASTTGLTTEQIMQMTRGEE